MYARVVTTRMDPERIDDASKIYRESILPAARLQSGFRDAQLLSDEATGKSYSITLWETEADMMAGEESGYLKEQFAKLTGYLVGPPVTEHFAVKVGG